jgi:hypothetical protein
VIFVVRIVMEWRLKMDPETTPRQRCGGIVGLQGEPIEETRADRVGCESSRTKDMGA